LTLPPAAGPYSQAIRAASQIWVAGQIPADVHGELIEGSVGEKTALCCRNVKAVLEAAGSEMARVVRVGVGLSCPGPFLLSFFFYWKGTEGLDLGFGSAG
jgi:enamine deaminase RidA (YjgF/YER057c/UK114 family)